MELSYGVTSTATELNIWMVILLHADADADRVVLKDGGTMKQVALTNLSA